MKWIYHKWEARVITCTCIHLTTDLQSLIYLQPLIYMYLAKNHLLARLSSDSNTSLQETTIWQMYPTAVASFLSLREKRSFQEL